VYLKAEVTVIEIKSGAYCRKVGWQDGVVEQYFENVHKYLRFVF